MKTEKVVSHIAGDAAHNVQKALGELMNLRNALCSFNAVPYDGMTVLESRILDIKVAQEQLNETAKLLDLLV